MIRVRFAPSPTGYLHIGGTRTALFNWLYVKAQQGKFILRIEDTDKKRSQKKYLDEILDSLMWLGLNWDEIYFQSQRFDIYKQYAQKLLEEGKAYQEKEAIILKMPQKNIKIEDLIHGLIEFDTATIKDQVLIKSDLSPTYNFACVVDDADMQISHVIRGDDHISNTPKQIVIYQALGFAVPKFAHLPLILGKDGGRLSKRTGATAISDYRNMGYLPEAIINYLMLLGWSPGANLEIVPIEQAIKNFSIKKVNKTAATFSIDKLNWINNHYIKKSDPNRILGLFIPFLKQKKFIKDDFDRNYLFNIVKLFQGRINTLKDFLDWADFAFLKKPKFDKEAKEKYLSQDLSKEFNLLIERLGVLENFEVLTVEAAFRGVVAELNLNASDLVHPVRVALTGKAIGPGLFETISMLGKDRTIERLKAATKLFTRKEKS